MGKVQPPFPGCLAWEWTESVPKATSSETRNPNLTEWSPSCHQLFPKGTKCPQSRGSIRFGENGRVTILCLPMEIYNWQSTGHFSICLVVLLWIRLWVCLWWWEDPEHKDPLLILKCKVTLALALESHRFRFESPLCHLLAFCSHSKIKFFQLKNGYDNIT